MSNIARIYCKTCGKSGPRLERFNHGVERVAAILNHRQVLEAFDKLRNALEANHAAFGVDDIIEVMYALQGHEGHEVVACDEYEALYGACAKRIDCPCGTPHFCRLAIAHEGACEVPKVKT